MFKDEKSRGEPYLWDKVSWVKVTGEPIIETREAGWLINVSYAVLPRSR